MKEFKFFHTINTKKRLTINDFQSYDGYYFIGEHYDIDGNQWVQFDVLEELLIEAPYGYKPFDRS